MTVLLVATTTGYQIRSFGDAARDLGIRLVIASDRCDHLDDPWRDGAIAVRFHEPGASALHLKAFFGDHRPEGIIAVGDRPTLLAAHAAAVFGLRGNSATAAVRSRNKLEAREAFRSVGLLAPSYLHVSIDSDEHTIAEQLTYPVVVKPLGLSGSRGVMRADTPQAFVAAFARLRQLLQSADIRLERDQIHESALIESFIPGREYAIEAVLTDGVFMPLAIFDKPDPLDGPFFEETIYVTPSRAPEPTQQALIDAVASAARALGLVHGPVHAECRVNAEGVYVLEIAARPIGGLCSRVLRFAHDGKTVGLEHVLLLHAVGKPLDGVVREACAAAVMMIPIPHRGVFKGVEGVESARRIPLIDDVQITAKTDALLTPLPEGRSYLGFIFARGDSPGEVEAAVRLAHRHLEFAIEREWPVVAGT